MQSPNELQRFCRIVGSIGWGKKSFGKKGTSAGRGPHQQKCPRRGFNQSACCARKTQLSLNKRLDLFLEISSKRSWLIMNLVELPRVPPNLSMAQVVEADLRLN